MEALEHPPSQQHLRLDAMNLARDMDMVSLEEKSMASQVRLQFFIAKLSHGRVDIVGLPCESNIMPRNITGSSLVLVVRSSSNRVLPTEANNLGAPIMYIRYRYNCPHTSAN